MPPEELALNYRGRSVRMLADSLSFQIPILPWVDIIPLQIQTSASKMNSFWNESGYNGWQVWETPAQIPLPFVIMQLCLEVRGKLKQNTGKALSRTTKTVKTAKAVMKATPLKLNPLSDILKYEKMRSWDQRVFFGGRGRTLIINKCGERLGAV